MEHWMIRIWNARLFFMIALVLPTWSIAQDDGPVEDAASVMEVPEVVEEPQPSAEPVASLRELRTVEESVHSLKERVFRSKATLQLLRELVIEGAMMGSGVAIWHVNDLTRAYQIESAQYFLDGKSIYAWTEQDTDAKLPRELEIRDQSASPGRHTLQVTMVLRGNGGGVFAYLDDYRFKVQSSFAFEVEEGTMTTVRVRALTRGGVRKAFVERPTIVYEQRTEQYEAE
jgi:hypothetical protein